MTENICWKVMKESELSNTASVRRQATWTQSISISQVYFRVLPSTADDW